MTPSLIGPKELKELESAARAAPPGDLVEVGVYKGGSAAVLGKVAREQGRRLFLFDTFTGIPFRDDGVDHHNVGDFDDTSAEAVQAAVPNAHIREGLFPDTLTDEVGPIALAHIDCDQYRSVRACCQELAPRMVRGGVMVFDDPNVLPGAALAVRESFDGDRIRISDTGKWRVYF